MRPFEVFALSLAAAHAASCRHAHQHISTSGRPTDYFDAADKFQQTVLHFLCIFKHPRGLIVFVVCPTRKM